MLLTEMPEADRLLALAVEVETGAVSQRSKYLELGEGIRLHGYTPAHQRQLLAQAGWRKERVSEFVRVVNVSSPMWESFKSEMVGFKVALARARGVEVNPKKKLNAMLAEFARIARAGLVEDVIFSEGRSVCVVVADISGRERRLESGGITVSIKKQKND